MAPADVAVVIPVYRDAQRAVEAARAVASQRLSGRRAETIVVDDGSMDDLAERLDSARIPHVRLVRLEHNAGRSVARNAGAASTTAAVIVFMDSDCLPVGDRFVEAHVEAIEAGAVASTGHVRGLGHGFWDRYQTEASSRRDRQHAAGVAAAGSSQNLAVDRRAFQMVGGFDPAYRQYGFEDRDLLARLARLGPVCWSPTACVTHMDRLDLPSVVAKLERAGRETAGYFGDRHPELYRALGYGRLDVSRRPAPAAIARALGGFIPRAARCIDRWLEAALIPYPLRRLAVRCISAAAFMAGTASRGDRP